MGVWVGLGVGVGVGVIFMGDIGVGVRDLQTTEGDTGTAHINSFN